MQDEPNITPDNMPHPAPLETPPSLPNLAAQAQALFNVRLLPEQVGAFERYAGLVMVWNERVNLTAITDLASIETRHFLDSLSILKAFPMIDGLRAIDVGTGAGFPGLPLRIAVPGVHMTLLEATGKKTQFLKLVAAELGLPDLQVVNLRAEEAGQATAHREKYDLVLARAVARLPALAEYLLPLCKIGGRCIAMKGESGADELRTAEKALRVLGGRPAGITQIDLPGTAEPHYLITIEKVDPTPIGFPRKPGTPTKKPL